MDIKNFLLIFLSSISISLITSASLERSNTEGKKYGVYRGRVYFFFEGGNKKSCIDCHTLSGIKKNDHPIIVGREVELENISDHINKVVGNLNKEEKDSLMHYIKRLLTKAVEKDSNSKFSHEKNEVMNKALRDRLLSLGYIGDMEKTYAEPLITVRKIAEFSSIELLKYSSLGFVKIRDSLSYIGFSLKSREQYTKAIVLPVVDLNSNSFSLTISFRNPISDSKANIETYDYFSGRKIDKKILDLQKTERICEKSVAFPEKYQRIIISIHFYTDDNLRVLGLKLGKLK